MFLRIFCFFKNRPRSKQKNKKFWVLNPQCRNWVSILVRNSIKSEFKQNPSLPRILRFKSVLKCMCILTIWQFDHGDSLLYCWPLLKVKPYIFVQNFCNRNKIKIFINYIFFTILNSVFVLLFFSLFGINCHETVR